MQVLFLAVLVGAAHPAFEDGKVAFNRVRVDLAAHILAALVVHRFMLAHLLEAQVVAALVGVDRGFLGDVVLDDRQDGTSIGALDVEATRVATTLNEREHGAQVLEPAARHLGELGLSDVGLVGLHGAAAAAHGGCERTSAHGLADTMAHEPRGIVLHLKDAVELVRADPLLGRAKKVDRLEPLV